MGELDGRVAVVTSSTRGVGRAIVNAFIREGASVVLNGRSNEKGWRALAELDAGPRARFLAGNAKRREDCERLVDEAVSAFGTIDILVNNAGGSENNAPVAELTDGALQDALEWNLWSTFWCTRRALQTMIPRRRGRIINISSLEGKGGKPVVSTYVAAKHAVNGLTKSCAAEVGELGITVNALCPGSMDTDIMRDVGTVVAESQGMTYEQFLELFTRESATKQMTDVDDVAAVAVLLASDAGAGITGSLISVDGGTAPY
jgi:3-hydroxybutyrate dehydrogenase